MRKILFIEMLLFCLAMSFAFSEDNDASAVIPTSESLKSANESLYIPQERLNVSSSPSAEKKSVNDYSFLSEYAADESSGGGIVVRRKKVNRLSIGASLGYLGILDGSDGSGEKYLSEVDSEKLYAGLDATGKFNNFAAGAGVYITFNGCFLPVKASFGYTFNTNPEDTSRPRYYLREESEMENLGNTSSSKAQEVDITVGISSLNAIPLYPSYSFVTSLMADASISLILPRASYLAMDIKFSVGWGHVFNNLLDRKDFFAINFMFGFNFDVLHFF